MILVLISLFVAAVLIILRIARIHRTGTPGNDRQQQYIKARKIHIVDLNTGIEYCHTPLKNSPQFVMEDSFSEDQICKNCLRIYKRVLSPGNQAEKIRRDIYLRLKKARRRNLANRNNNNKEKVQQ